MLYIFNREEEVTAILEQADKEAPSYSDAKIKNVLNGEQVLTFRAPYSSDIFKEHGYVACQNKYKQWLLFLITEMVEIHGETIDVEITAESTYIELNDVIIENEIIDRKQPSVVLPTLLNGTRWEIGTITGTEIHDLTIKYESVLSALQTFRDRWNGELTFRIEIAGNKISKRIVDFTTQKGEWKGKRFEFSKDLVEIERTIDAKELKTALYGIGNETGEEPNKKALTFADIAWSKANGDPVDKPLGQTWVGDEPSRIIFGKKLVSATQTDKEHLFGVVSHSTDDPIELLKLTYNNLLQLKNPNITYKGKVIDFAEILGIEQENVDLGDLCALIDHDLELLLQVRIIELDEDLDYPENSEITLGNFLPRFSDTNESDTLNELISKVNNIGDNLGGDFISKGEAIDPSWIDTEFDFARDAIRTGNGTVIMNEADGILIVDDPDNPQKAIKLQAGQIALANTRDLTTGEFNWRNFGTGTGWLADLVEAGKISFNNASGGTLTLGGIDNADGVLLLKNSLGEEIATLSGDYGGFDHLRIDELLDTQNVVFKTYNGTLLENQDANGDIVFYVDPNDGDDNAIGTSGAPISTITEALRRIPTHLLTNVYIYFLPTLLNDSSITITGFSGPGAILIRLWDTTVRYIRDYINGSNVNVANHWTEINAIHDSGTTTRGKTITPMEGLKNEVGSGTNWDPNRVLDGVVNTTQYYDGGTIYDENGKSIPVFVINYLGGGYTSLAKCIVWHFYNDGRTYNDTKTQISEDGNKWHTIFDSARQGTYKETSSGHEMFLDRGTLHGSLDIRNNQARIIVNDLFVYSEGTLNPLDAWYSSYVQVERCVLFGSGESHYCAYCNSGNLRLRDCEMNNGVTAGIIAAYGGRIEIIDCVGGGYPYGHYAHGDGLLGGTGKGCKGSSADVYRRYGGTCSATWSHATGVYSPVTIISKTATFKNNASDTWSEPYGAWRTTDNDVFQGKYSSYGPYRGFWFFGTGMRNTVMGKRIKKIRVYVSRSNSSGVAQDGYLELRYHGYSSIPGSNPSLSSASKGVYIDRGQSLWIDCTSQFKSAFEAGSAYGIGIDTSSTAETRYIRCTTSCTVEVQYEIVT